MSEISIKLSADEAKAVQGFLGLVNAQGKVQQSLEKLSAAGEKVDREQQRWQREAKRAVEQGVPAWERQTQVVAELGLMLQRDEIDQRKFNAAVEASARSLGLETDASRKLAAEQKASEEQQKQVAMAQREAADAQRQWASESKRLLDGMRSPMDRHNEKVGQLKRLLNEGKIEQNDFNEEVRKSKRAMEEADEAGKKSFGSDAITGLTELALAWGSVSTAVGVVTTAIDEMEAKRKEAAQSVRDSAGGLDKLKQLAGGDQDKMDRMAGAAERMYAAGGAKTLGESSQVIFELESAGLLEDAGLFSDLMAQGIVGEPAEMARSVKTLVKNFGRKETGDTKAIMSKGFAAAQFAPVSVEELLKAASQTGTFAKALGLRDEEALAAVSQTTAAAGDASKGSTQVSALFNALDKATRAPRPELSAAEVASIETLRQKRAKGELTPEEQAAVEKDAAFQEGRGDQLDKRDRRFLRAAQAKTPTTAELDAEAKQREIANTPVLNFQGKTLLEDVKILQDLEKTNQAMFAKVLSEKEALVGYRVLAANLSGRGGYEEVLGAADRAEADDLTTKNLALRTPRGAANLVAQQAKAKRDLGMTDLGTEEVLADALQDELMRDMKDRGVAEWKRNEVEKWLFKGEMDVPILGQIPTGRRRWGGDATFLDEFSGFASPELRAEIEAVRRQAKGQSLEVPKPAASPRMASPAAGDGAAIEVPKPRAILLPALVTPPGAAESDAEVDRMIGRPDRDRRSPQPAMRPPALDGNGDFTFSRPGDSAGFNGGGHVLDRQLAAADAAQRAADRQLAAADRLAGVLDRFDHVGGRLDKAGGQLDRAGVQLATSNRRGPLLGSPDRDV